MKRGMQLIHFLEFIRSIIIYVLAAFLFVAFFLRPMQISGTSMTPTLLDGEKVMINVVNNLISDPDRFDVVVVKHGDEMWVKRVIGLPNETLSYEDGQLLINGKKVEESFLQETYMKETLERLSIQQFNSDMKELTLGEDEYFLVGDNRPESLDSRNVQVGAFHRQDIIAIGVVVFWPFDKVGYVG
ncbi:signal peptidase I [Merdibacter massiliensis]|uniref:signal peptidase I n=1 Tax=Merdibacter massiliensis TaxID=1871030 RepID=UPI0009FA8E68|nr:signal peptidase I [Merdibacter massiliensis]